MTPLRVLHAYKIYRPDVEGGIPEVMASLTRDAAPDLKSSILVARAKGWSKQYSVEGVNVTAAGSLGNLFSTPMAPAYPALLARRFASTDVIVHHAPFPLTDLALLTLPSTAALVVYWHAEIIGRAMLRQMLAPAIRHSLMRADRIIVSHESMIASSAFLKPFADKCIAIPYGADVHYWNAPGVTSSPGVQTLRARYPRLIVAIGRLVPYKGFSSLLKAMRGLDAQLVIIGDGPLAASLAAESRDLQISDRVTFAGRIARDEIRDYVHASRVLAMPSTTAAEAFGIVQIEAMAAGKPVINTYLPTAVPHIARDGLEGFTVAPNNASALGHVLRVILSDERLAAQLGAAARARAKAQFTLELFRNRNFEVYREVVADRHLQTSISS